MKVSPQLFMLPKQKFFKVPSWWLQCIMVFNDVSKCLQWDARWVSKVCSRISPRKLQIHKIILQSKASQVPKIILQFVIMTMFQSNCQPKSTSRIVSRCLHNAALRSYPNKLSTLQCLLQRVFYNFSSKMSLIILQGDFKDVSRRSSILVLKMASISASKSASKSHSLFMPSSCSKVASLSIPSKFLQKSGEFYRCQV